MDRWTEHSQDLWVTYNDAQKHGKSHWTPETLSHPAFKKRGRSSLNGPANELVER